jgi:hypothetical protein
LTQDGTQIEAEHADTIASIPICRNLRRYDFGLQVTSRMDRLSFEFPGEAMGR